MIYMIIFKLHTKCTTKFTACFTEMLDFFYMSMAIVTFIIIQRYKFTSLLMLNFTVFANKTLGIFTNILSDTNFITKLA